MRLAVLAVVLCLSAPAFAAEYETFIDVQSEEELYDLFADQQISEDTFNTLIELYRRGVDLNRASREELYALPNLTYREVDAILAYRKEAGFIADPVALVLAGAMSERKLLSIGPFLIVRDPKRPALAADGWIKVPTTWAAGSDKPPPAAIQTRVGIDDFTFGVAGVLTHNRLGEVSYDPLRMGLSANEPDARLHVPKLYALYETDDFSAIAGTYRIGFGQRLTFDNTDRYTANGFYLDDAIFRGTDLSRVCRESGAELASPCTGDARYKYATPDYRWRDGLRGAAIGARKLKVGDGWVQAHGFVSHETRSIYQYELYDRNACDDPRNDDDPNCAAPRVYRRQADVLAPTTRFSFLTLPDMYNETIVGGNVTYFKDRRAHIGVTGYGADISWLADGIDLDFQEWSRTPFGGGFGAVGVDGAWGKGRTDIYLEVARSFDSMPDDDDGGGGFGGVLRTTATFPKSEIEASFRYYERAFANPYARPISAADEFDGLRARDETGARLRYTGTLQEKLALRAQADFWVQASDGSIPEALLFWRADYEVSKRWRYGLWLLYQNKNLEDNGHDDCFSVSTEEDENGEAIPCGGQKFQATGRARFQPFKKMSLSAQYQHEWQDGAAEEFDAKFRQDLSGWLIVNAYPMPKLRLRARMRYLYEDISDNTSFEQSLWAYIDLAYRYSKTYRLRARYDLFLWLDDRASTMARTPSPENWFFLELEARF